MTEQEAIEIAQMADLDEGGAPHGPEPIDEPGDPVRGPASWRRIDVEQYRQVPCTREAACAGVAARAGWRAWGCHGCRHASAAGLLPPPGSHATSRPGARRNTGRKARGDK